jgi:hypothetical protein
VNTGQVRQHSLAPMSLAVIREVRSRQCRKRQRELFGKEAKVVHSLVLESFVPDDVIWKLTMTLEEGMTGMLLLIGSRAHGHT